MSAPFDYSTLKSVHVSFSNPALNHCASGKVPDFADFFYNSTTTDHLDSNLLEVIRQQVTALLNLCAGDETRTPALVNKCYFKYFSADSDGTSHLRTQGNIEDAFQEAIRHNSTVVKIMVMTEALFFHPSFNGNNLDLVFTTATELATMSSSAPPSGSIPFPAGSSAAITQPAPVPTNKFCHSLLPDDVKQRYDNFVRVAACSRDSG
jgi:hypothetical protein